MSPGPNRLALTAAEGWAVIALGSNLGSSRETVHQAVDRLEQLSAGPALRSSLWQSEPVDCPPGSPPFINAVIALRWPSDQSPEELLARLQSIEREFGRAPKKVLNEARLLDLDLIAYGSAIRSSPELTLPHPRAHLRAFVLAPLAEIAPDFRLPGQAKTVQELLDSSDCSGTHRT